MRNHVKPILVSLSAVLALVAGSVVGTNLVTAGPAPIPGPVTVNFNYNGATGGNTVASDTVTSGTQANTVLPHPTKPGVSFSGWFNTQSLLNGQRITTIEESDAGTLIAGYVPPELAQTLNLAMPVAPTCANGLGICVLGDIGPGGGLVFLISGSTAYEMAPKTWNGGIADPTNNWSVALQAAADYRGGVKTDWFLPSKDELNAMYTNSRVSGFDTVTYGFADDYYWSSSQYSTSAAWAQDFDTGDQDYANKGLEYFFKFFVRPIRSF